MKRARSVFFDFQPPEKAVISSLRSKLMMGIEDIVENNGWSKVEAARHCGISQARMSQLLAGQFSDFSLKALTMIAERLDLTVNISVSGPVTNS